MSIRYRADSKAKRDNLIGVGVDWYTFRFERPKTNSLPLELFLPESAVGRQETPTSEIWGSALAGLLLVVITNFEIY